MDGSFPASAITTNARFTDPASVQTYLDGLSEKSLSAHQARIGFGLVLALYWDAGLVAAIKQKDPVNMPPKVEPPKHAHWNCECETYSSKHYAVETCKKCGAQRPYHPRPCITCETEFMSEGSHNRMCDNCRRQSHYFGAA